MLEGGASGYRWAAATVTSTSAASLELGSDGVPVMAIGGFSGSDPAPTLAEFENLVAKGEIHYYVSGGGVGGAGGPGGAPGGPGQSGATAPSGGSAATEASLPGGFLGAGGTGDASKISSWVAAHFKSETVGGTTVYDLTAPTAGSGSAGTAPSGTGSATGK